MKLENKVGLYALAIILLFLIGITIMVYPFEHYEEFNGMNENTLELFLLMSVLLTKLLGLAMLFFGSYIYRNNFRTNNDEKKC